MSGDPIADYLAELRAGLRTPPARTADILTEAEDHLRESAAASRAGGLPEEAAQRAAITAFGPARRIIRAHWPSASAFAAEAGLKAWPLLAAYLLLSVVVAGIALYVEYGVLRGETPVPVGSARRGDRTVTVVKLVPGVQHAGLVAVAYGACVLAGLLLLAGFLIVHRRRQRSGKASARLPRGLFSLAAALGLFALGGTELAVLVFGWAHPYPSLYTPGREVTNELVLGGVGAAILMAVGCAASAAASLARWALARTRAT